MKDEKLLLYRNKLMQLVKKYKNIDINICIF